MPFIWVSVQELLEGGNAVRTNRILINTDQICSLTRRTLSMADAESYYLSYQSASEILHAVYIPANDPGYSERDAPANTTAALEGRAL